MLHIGFLLIVVLAVGLFVAGTGKPRWPLLTYMAWTIVIGILSYKGFFLQTETMPPRMLLVLIPAILFTTVYSFDLSIPKRPACLMAINVLRIPVEFYLYWLYLNGLVPELMTFAGWNFDILIGVSALILLIWPGRIKQQLLRWWHYMGLTLLILIVLLAVLSAPSPVQLFGDNQPNVALLSFPFTLLPAIVVPLIFISHLLGINQTKQQKL